MKTRNLGISLNQGDDFSLVILIKNSSGPINLTGYEFLGEMKLNTNSDSPIIAEFVFTILDQTTNTGQVQWTLPNTETLELEVSTSNAKEKKRLTTPYVFDIKMLDTSGKITRILQGIIYVSPLVTQEAFGA